MEESHSQTSPISDKNKKQNLQAIKEYIDTHYADKITLDQLSSKYFINKFYLTRSFKDQFGLPVNSYLIQIRVTHAKQLLRFTDLSVEKIGQECGMNDANYFSRIFKKTEGIAPGEYRKMWKMQELFKWTHPYICVKILFKKEVVLWHYALIKGITKKLSQLTQTPMINGILEAITAVVCCYVTALNVD